MEAWAIPEVVGGLDARTIEKKLEVECKADVLRIDAITGAIPNDGVFPRIVYVQFPALPVGYTERAQKLAEHGMIIVDGD